MIIPERVSLQFWAASLIQDFPLDNIPLLRGENWREWGDFLIQENSFASEGAPSTKLYKDWKTWADAIFKCMANF